MDITELLSIAIKNKASDLHLSAGVQPLIRVEGDMHKLDVPVLDSKEVYDLLFQIMTDKQQKNFKDFLETDFSFDLTHVARFRVNVFHQSRGPAAVFRHIP